MYKSWSLTQVGAAKYWTPHFENKLKLGTYLKIEDGVVSCRDRLNWKKCHYRKLEGTLWRNHSEIGIR